MTSQVIKTRGDIAIYDNGMERNTKTGRIIKPPPHTLITPEKSTDIHRRRQEQKQAAIVAAVNESVEDSQIRKQYGELAWLAAVAKAQYIKATTPDDPKSTDAARFLVAETGYSAATQPAQPAPPFDSVAIALYRFIRAEIDKAQAIDVGND